MNESPLAAAARWGAHMGEPRRLPMLCDCQRMDGYVEHRDMHSTYVLWVLDADASHVVFLHKKWLNGLVYNGVPFVQLLFHKDVEECCKMISRILLAALRYKPDYLVVVADDDTGAPLASGYCMGSIMGLVEPSVSSVRAIAEGVEGENNILGRRLSDLCRVIADRGFFSDPKNRKYGLRFSDAGASSGVVV